jgi:hypothetical protein
LYDPISDATIASSNGTPMRSIDASMKSRSVFDSAASFQPHLGERLPGRQRTREGPGILDPQAT